MYCNFQADASQLPYRMASSFHCEDPLFHPTTTAGLSPYGGLADVTHGAACDEPNCMRCVRHYAACMAESRATEAASAAAVARGGSSGGGGGGVSGGGVRGQLAAMWGAAVARSDTTAIISRRSHGIGIVVGFVNLKVWPPPVPRRLDELRTSPSRMSQSTRNQIRRLVARVCVCECQVIPPLAAKLAEIGRPVSRTQLARSTLALSFLIMTAHTVCALHALPDAQLHVGPTLLCVCVVVVTGWCAVRLQRRRPRSAWTLHRGGRPGVHNARVLWRVPRPRAVANAALPRVAALAPRQVGTHAGRTQRGLRSAAIPPRRLARSSAPPAHPRCALLDAS